MDDVSLEVRVSADPVVLSAEVAAEIARLIRHVVTTRGCCALALAGGQTPRGVYQVLASAYGEHLPWHRVHLFWGDERYVPPDDPQSNYRLVREALLDHVPLPAENLHSMPTDQPDPAEAAQRYEATLRAYFRGSRPRFDLVLLGVGRDGHTASLFPGSSALEETERWVVVTRAPVEPVLRLSLSLPILNAAYQVWFLVSGLEKRPIVQTLFQDPERARQRYPAAMVQPQGRVIWWLDRAAWGPENKETL